MGHLEKIQENSRKLRDIRYVRVLRLAISTLENASLICATRSHREPIAIRTHAKCKIPSSYLHPIGSLKWRTLRSDKWEIFCIFSHVWNVLYFMKHVWNVESGILGRQIRVLSLAWTSSKDKRAISDIPTREFWRPTKGVTSAISQFLLRSYRLKRSILFVYGKYRWEYKNA